MSKEKHRKCAKCGATAAMDASCKFHRFPKPGTTNILKSSLRSKNASPEEGAEETENESARYNKTIFTASQETQSPTTKLFGKLRCSDSSTETVNLMRKSKKKPTRNDECPNNPMEHIKCECKEKEKEKKPETCCTKSLPKVSQSQTKTNKGHKHKVRNDEQDRDDTFSFTSCSLKKLISSESPRLMMALIVIAGALAIMLAIKCVCAPFRDHVIDRERRSNDDDDNRKPWETSKSRLMTEFTDLVAKDAPRDSNLHSGEDYNDYAVPDLASILDPIKVGEGYGSNNLRDFYRKLLKTDIQIKNLKKGFANSNRGSSIDLADPINRLKRSAESTEIVRVHLQTLNKPKQEHFGNSLLVSGPMKVNKNNGEKSQHSFDGNAVDPAEKLEELKDQLRHRSEMFKHEYEVDGLIDTSEPKHPQKVKHNQVIKLPEWVNSLLLNRGTSSTRHRRLLQLYDDDDDDADDEDETLVDYEEQTKRQRGSEEQTKRQRGSEKTPVLVTIDQKKVTKPVPKTDKPTSGKEFKEPTSPLYNEEINFLIDAAWKMKSDNQQNQETNEKPNASNMDKFIKKLKHKMFLKDLTQQAVDISGATGKSKNSTHLEIAPKHKDRNFMFVHRRSLKSIENDESNDEIHITDSNVESDDKETLIFKEFELDKVRNITDKELDNEYEHTKFNFTHKTLNNTNTSVFKEQVLKLSKDPLKNSNSTAAWGLGEIFGMIADFCMFMTGFDTEQEDGGYRFLFDLVKMLHQNKTQEKKMYDTKSQIDVSIDSEMVANIGHRSRVLLSIEENVENVTSTTESYVITNKENINTSKENNKVTNSSNEPNINKFLKTENRTVVKRSAGDNNIFWNDMYDEEYGIKELEDDMKDKSAVKLNDLVGKDNWISAKFKTLAKSFKNRKIRRKQQKEQNSKNLKNNTRTRNAKRSAAFPDESSKRMFEDLTVNMKRVCHEAAVAIHETNNREVRADSEQATTLMQQLVGLMAELVDLQVKEKTCVQLPEDLRTFLAWLTTPNKEERHDVGLVIDTYDSGPGPNPNPSSYDFMSINARSECLGTIHDVEDLILQYDEMSEEDKSKMSGVREYLEHQLHYLHKQLSNFNEYGSLSMYHDPSSRMRREPKTSTKRHRKRFKFLQKHTKMTASTSDDMSTKTNRVSNKNANNKGRNYKGNDNFDNSKGKDNNVFGKMGSHGKDLKQVLKDYFGTVNDNVTRGKHSRA